MRYPDHSCHRFRATIWVAAVFTLSISTLSRGDESYSTGYAEPTAEQQAWMDENLLEVKRVKLNELGLNRVEAHLKEKGAKATGKKAVRMGYDLEGVVGTESSAVVFSTAAKTAFVAYADALDDDALPAAVDNSLLDSFPPVGSQYGGACSQFSSIYYTLTHMTAMARG